MHKLTEKAQSLLQQAAMSAHAHDHQYLEPTHVLMAVLQSNALEKLMTDCGADVSLLQNQANAALQKIVTVRGASRTQEQIAASPAMLKVLDAAQQSSSGFGDQFVGREALLLGLFADSKIHQLLQQAGLRREVLLTAVKQKRGGKTLSSADAESDKEALAKYTQDLTAAAREGKLDPVIGRDEEIRRTIQVLSRRTKNNPVLIGEPGVGKTAIAEGLAQRIVAGDVPQTLVGKQVLSLDLGLLIAGAKFRGEFEERLKGVLQQIIESAGEIIVFVDELHTLVGAGATDGAMDASNLMKPALARGELHCVGATTLAEYRKYIEKDAALARRFQTILVEEPSVDQAISILRGLKEKYEMHHGVRISDASIIAAAKLSSRYITGRFLPDKAIDVIDEAASRLRMAVDSKPEEIDSIDRKIIQLKIEREALRKENDEVSTQRLPELEQELTVLEAQSLEMTAQWEAERDQLAGSTDLKEKLEQARQALLQAQREGAFEKAGELAYSTIPQLEAALQKAEHRDSNPDSSSQPAPMLSKTVTADDIALVIARWTGIPAERMLAGEQQQLLQMEQTLRRQVIAQDHALKVVSQVVRRARAGLQDDSRPLGSFLFLGPTGVGKTELTKALAEFLFNDPAAVLRFDMSEYSERHAVARLIGAPPGYVGHDEGGALTEAIRRKPYQVILFDEIEKAHPDIYNVLLQVLDDGRMTDGKGTTVDFCHSLIILTSNLGAEHFQEDDADAQGQPLGYARDAMMEAVRGAFRPEFLNRLDEIVIFNRLVQSQMSLIVDLELRQLEKRLMERGYTLRVSDDAKAYLARVGFDARYGARPLKRAVVRYVSNPLSEHLLVGDWPEGSAIVVNASDSEAGGLDFSIA